MGLRELVFGVFSGDLGALTIVFVALLPIVVVGFLVVELAKKLFGGKR